MSVSEAYVKILRWGIFVSLFLPLVIFSQYISPFHFGKMIIFRTLLEIITVFYILLILVDKRYRPKWTLVLISFTIFTALYFLTGILGVNFYRSFWGTLERMGGIFSFLHFWVYFVILISVIKTKEDWQKILKISVFVGLLSILFAYGQRFIQGKFFIGWQHGERVIGTIGNPALFAGYLLFILFLALLFLLRKKTHLLEKGLFAAVLILGIPVLLMTAVRGSILSFLGSAFLLAIFFIFTSRSKKVKIYLSIAIIIFLVLAVSVWLSRNQNWVKNISWLERISSISLETSTVQTRLWSWKSAIDGFKEKPVFGWGPENFTVLHTKYFDPRHFTHIGAETIWDRAHNVVLDALATMGIVGLLSYLAIFGVVFYILIKKFKNKKIGRVSFGVLSVMLIAYFGHNLFIFDTFANYFLFFLVLGYIDFIGRSRRTPSSINPADLTTGQAQIVTQSDAEKIGERRPSIFLTVILLILAIILAYQTNIKPSRANFACTRAILAGRAGSAQKAVDKYQEALNYNSPQGAYEIRHKLAQFAIQFTENQRRKNKDFDPSLLYYSINQVAKNIETDPLDSIPYLYVGRMYIILIDKEPEIAGEQAELAILKALDLNRKNPRIWYELGQAQLSRGKEQEAYESFKTAAELNPKVATSWWFVGVAAFQVGNYQEAIADVEKAMELGYTEYRSSIADLMRLVNIYEKVNNYQKIIEYYNLAIEEQPQNPQLYASLAATYATIGDYEKAREMALKAAEIDPSFREEAEEFIKSLER